MHDAGAIILAGGGSSRMGQNKSLLPYAGLPLIQHIARQLATRFETVLVSTNTPGDHAFLGLPMVADHLPGQGPLMGLASSLSAATCNWNLIVATDIPELPLDLLPAMFEQARASQCVVLQTPDGRYQPQFGLYHRGLCDEIWALLAAGERRFQAIFDRVEPRTVPVAPERLRNLNTPDAYAQAVARGPGDQGLIRP